MPFKIFAPLLLIALITCASFVSLAQDQDEDENVRGSFITTRKTASSSAGRTSAKTNTAQRTTTKQSTGKNTGRPTNKNTSNATNKNADNSATKNVTNNGASGNTGLNSANAANKNNAGGVATNNASARSTIGLGYSLYMRDANGDAVRVDPEREFHNGDRIRVALEANTDGYLYVFHTENSGDPEMIFPDARLNGGSNAIAAHVPYEIPSSKEADERLRWFNFYGNPATERLYIIVTRQPLPGVPTGDALVKYCRENQSGCPWRPAAGIWSQVKAAMNARVHLAKSKTYGQAQTSDEREATTRGLGLDQGAPPPSVIRMNVSSNSNILVTALDLVHK